MTFRRLLIVVALALVAGLLPAGPITTVEPARAMAVFNVDSTLDTSDAVPGNGICDDGAGNCTLRAAVEEANALAGTDTVNVPAGLYDLASPLYPSEDLVVAGAGSATTELFANSGFSSSFVLANGPVVLDLSGFTFTNSGGGDCIYIDETNLAATSAAGSTLSVSDSVFDHCGDAGILAATDSAPPTEPGEEDVGGPVYIHLTNVDIIGHPTNGCGANGGCYGVLIDSNGGSFTADNVTVTGTRFDAFLLAFNRGDGVVDVSNSTISDVPGEGLEVYVRTGWTADVSMTDTVFSNVEGIALWGGTPEGSTYEIVRTSFVGGTRATDLIGSLTITDSTFDTNSSVGVGWYGGAHLEVTGSTFVGNDYYGIEIASDPGATARIVNSTFSGNVAAFWADIDVDLLEVVNTTITGNTDHGLESYAATANIVNTIVSGNTLDCLVGNNFPITSLGHNIDSDGSCGFGAAGDQVGVDPLLGPLADNGGPTDTHALGVGSPAIDAADDLECPLTDQRGFIRPADGDGVGGAQCDIGAVEAGAGVGPPPGGVVVTWDADRTRRADIPLDSTFDITLLGDAGGDATATVDVMSWYQDGDTGGAFLGVPTASSMDVALVEGPAGEYTGSLPVAGMSEVLLLTGELTTAGGTVDDATSFGLPADVSGELEINVDLTVPPALLPGPRVVVTSPSTYDGETLGTGLTDSLITRDLAPADDYELRVIDLDNRTVADDTVAEVRGGLVTPVDFIASPSPFVPFVVEVRGLGAQPLANVEVTVTDSTLDEIVKDETGDDGRVGAIAVGAAIEIAIDPLLEPFLGSVVDHDLTALDEVVVVDLDPVAPTGVVSGMLTLDGSGLPPPPLPVSVRSEVGGRFFTSTTMSNPDGSYEAESFLGEVRVRVYDPAIGAGVVTEVIAGDTTIDVVVVPPEPVELTIDLSTLFAGDLTPTPIDLEWRQAVHFRVRASSVAGSFEPREDVVEIRVAPGYDIEVCADGVESGLSADCTVVSPSGGAATAVLQLTQVGRVVGQLQMSDGSAADSWSGDAYLVDPGGDRDFHMDSFGPSDVFQIGLLEEGDFDIEIVAQGAAGAEFARTSVSVTNGDVIDLGIVPLAGPSGPFGTHAQTNVTISPTSLLPGDTATARLIATNGGNAVTDTVMSLRIPTGSTVVPGSVLLDGSPVAFSEIDGWVDVDVGNVASGESHTIRVWLETSTDFPSDQLVTQGRISYVDGVPVTELLGLAAAAVNRVTIDAPRITDVRTLVVSGRAPAGENVEVTADGIPLGATTATAGGLWNLRVELPETPLRRAWALQASTQSGATEVTSERRGIVWDPLHNPLQRVVMRQEGGAAIEWRPTDGVARFPFVHAPKAAIDVRLYFKDPDRVAWATASVGTSPAGRGNAIFQATAPDCFNAVGDGARSLLCYWEATVIPSGNELGNIFVAWDSDSVVIDLSPTPAPDLLTEQEVRAQLRPPFNGFEDLVVVDEASGTDITAVIPGFDVDMQVTLESTPGLYTPTAEDVALADQAGAEIFGIETTQTLDDDLWEIITTFFIPDSAKTAGSVKAAPDLSINAVPGVEIPGEHVVLTISASNDSITANPAKGVPLQAVGAFVQSAAALAGQAGNLITVGGFGTGLITDPENTLQEMWDHARQFCSGPAVTEFQTRIDGIRRDISAQTLLTTATTLIGLAIGPIGGLITAVIGFGLDQAFAYEIRNKIEAILNDLVNDPNCTPPPEDPEEEPPGDKEAEPTWIHDPSGYAYEVFEDVRLEGVTATVQFSDTDSGPWEIWDADWYGQDNPQMTDADGRYGWDVPEGWWRVRFDKAGYETAYSEVLEVLPPHFDVNVPLVSLSPPVIASGTGYAENTFLEVWFENFVLSDWVDEFNVAVTDEGDNPVPVVISVVDERTTGDGDDVAKVFRFDTGGPLTLHDEYTVTFDESLPSYAGIPAGDDLEVVIEIGTLDPFTDDDGSEFEDDIEWMYNQGVVMACNPPDNDMVCPDDLVTREMVASYFVAALDLTEDGGGDLFIDDDGSEHESDIDKLATAGITFGCNPPTNDMFCPDGLVTRGEIAAFFARALDLIDGVGADWFIDDDHSVFESDIDKLRTAAITYGCNPPINDMYCPDGWLTKGQISALFHRALG